MGSSQIRAEYKGEVWVFSGDYKDEDDGVAVPYEPVKCYTFITECTEKLSSEKLEDRIRRMLEQLEK